MKRSLVILMSALSISAMTAGSIAPVLAVPSFPVLSVRKYLHRSWMVQQLRISLQPTATL